MALYADKAAAVSAAEQLKVYAQPQRIMVLCLLLTGEHTVGEIEAATGIGQPMLSQQLAGLRRAELVTTRRESKSIHYALANEDVALCVRTLEAMFGGGADSIVELRAIWDTRGATPAAQPPNAAATFARIL